MTAYNHYIIRCKYILLENKETFLENNTSFSTATTKSNTFLKSLCLSNVYKQLCFE